MITMGNKSKKTDVDKRDMIKWTERMDNVLIDALLHQQSMGNRIDKVFTTAAYDNMVKELRDKIGMPVEKGHLKNRMKTLKHNFNECHDLFKTMNGFTWSPETKMWLAKPEVWKALVKVKPEAKKWMTTPIAHYDKLVLLFAKDWDNEGGVPVVKATPVRGVNSSSGGNCFDLQNEVTLNLDDINDMNGGTSQLATPVEANSQADSQAPSQSATSLKGKKRKAKNGDAFERELKCIREAIKDVAQAIREGNIIAERGRPRVYTEQEVFAELVNLGIDSCMRFKAYTFLIANAGHVRAFFGCPANERKEFLMQMMYSSDDSR